MTQSTFICKHLFSDSQGEGLLPHGYRVCCSYCNKALWEPGCWANRPSQDSLYRKRGLLGFLHLLYV